MRPSNFPLCNLQIRNEEQLSDGKSHRLDHFVACAIKYLLLSHEFREPRSLAIFGCILFVHFSDNIFICPNVTKVTCQALHQLNRTCSCTYTCIYTCRPAYMQINSLRRFLKTFHLKCVVITRTCQLNMLSQSLLSMPLSRHY